MRHNAHPLADVIACGVMLTHLLRAYGGQMVWELGMVVACAMITQTFCFLHYLKHYYPYFPFFGHYQLPGTGVRTDTDMGFLLLMQQKQ